MFERMRVMVVAGVMCLGVSAAGCIFNGQNDVTPECEEYCELALDTCVNESSIFNNEGECFAACEEYNTSGADGDTDGDTLQCRVQHLKLAKNAPAQHCPHGSPDGAGICVQTTSRCDVYCADIQERCNADATRQYDSTEDCENACLSFRQNGPAGSETGNTVQCRMTFLFQSPDDFSPVQKCEAAGAASMQCVDEQEE